MSLSEVVAAHVPGLRRYSRALSGSQEAGDAHVVAMLQVLSADPSALDSDQDVRVALYRLFLREWASRSGADGSGRAVIPAEETLKALTPQSRQAFLLHNVEGFSLEETASIMEMEAAAAAACLEEAAHEIAGQVATTVLIIEDEAMIAMDLKAIVTELGHAVSGIARTHGEAIQAVAAERPGLVLADIQLADDSSGLEAVNEILQTVSVPVIFITSYQERLLTGQRPEPTFLVTKPYGEETLKAVISQALFFRTEPGRASGG